MPDYPIQSYVYVRLPLNQPQAAAVAGAPEKAFLHQKYLTHLISRLKTALAEIVLIVLSVKLDNTIVPSSRAEVEETIQGLISLLEKGTENPAGSLNFLTSLP